MNVLTQFIRDLSFENVLAQKGVQGDPWQMGGTFVIAPHDAVLFAHVSGEAGDHPDLADVLAALELSSP